MHRRYGRLRKGVNGCGDARETSGVELNTESTELGALRAQRGAQRGIAVPQGGDWPLESGRYSACMYFARMSFVSVSALAIWRELKLWLETRFGRGARANSG